MIEQDDKEGLSGNQQRYNEKLHYRRQFILGESFLDKYSSWKKLTLNEHYALTVHPELNVQQISSGKITITLIGYILDPYEPNASNLKIINRLMADFSHVGTFGDFLKSTFSLGGRWVLLIEDSVSLKLFHDVTGCRQVFYTESNEGELLWCASQPNLIAEKVNITLNPEAVDFLKSGEEKGNEYIFPGDTSLYKGVRHLLPNHYLNLSTGEVVRYWPKDSLNDLSLKDCVSKASKLLKGLMQCAFNRFPLGLSLTAGRDTRLMLASAGGFKERLKCFTLMYWELNKQSPDIKIPTLLCKRLGIFHHIIQCQEKATDDFLSIFKKNVSGAHQAYGSIAEGLYEKFPQERVCIKGIAIPVAKWHYQRKLTNRKRRSVTPELLAELNDSKGNLFAIKNFDLWLRGIENCYNIDILDLFKWEISEGNWQAMAQLEFDIAHEVFVPFNCRELLTTMLSLDVEYRKPPKYILHSELIARLWPEVLIEPINPPVGIREHIKSFLPHPFYLFLKSIKEFMGFLK